MFVKFVSLFVFVLSIFFPVLAMAGTTYTDQATWEEAIPNAASVTEVTFSGTPGTTVANGTVFTL